ncbi:MAG: ComF family protein [Planctomycetota bacterium]
MDLKAEAAGTIIGGVDTSKPKRADRSVKETLRFGWQSVNQLLWPAVCVNCRESICETDENLCRKCWAQLLACTAGDYCRRCGRDVSRYALVKGACPDCQGQECYFNQISRSGVYKEALKQMILSFKKGRTELRSVLGFLLDSARQGAGFDSQIDLFVPVPLHWSRRLSRGFNQAQVLAKRLDRRSARISTDLVRVRRTKQQPTMPSPAARAKNVAGAFAVRRRHNFAARNICLVDDIKTTGATLNECAKTLKEAGASKVFALVLAVAGQQVS